MQEQTMATKVAKKVAATRITKESIRQSQKRDLSPKWEGTETWTGEQFTRHFHEAMRYYRVDYNGKDFKSKVIQWMTEDGMDSDLIADFKKIKDWRCNVTMGSIAFCLMRGMPPVHKEFNGGKDSAEWLRKAIRNAVEMGKWDIEESREIEVKKDKPAEVFAPSIQDRIREQAAVMALEIDVAIDEFITDPEKFDPKAIKLVSLLRGKGAKAAQARHIKSFYDRDLDELEELASGQADEQLREGYSHLPKKHVRKLIEFYKSVQTACEQIIAEAKVLKAPRKKRVKPVEDLVKKIKFKISDDKLGITSVPATSIVGAQALVVYNTKNRKLGIYLSKTSEGLQVKGAGITNYTDKSVQRTLRNPAQQIKEFKDQNTQKRAEVWFGKIKTTEIPLNGRLNNEIIILKAFK
jgi:hypothetical protein